MISKCPSAGIFSIWQTLPAEHPSTAQRAGQSRSYEEGGTTWQNVASGILQLPLFLRDTPDFSLKACFPYWQRSAAPACRNVPQILALPPRNLEALFSEEPFPPCTEGRTRGKVKQSSYSLPQPSKSHSPVPTQAHTDTLQQEPSSCALKQAQPQAMEGERALVIVIYQYS